ncbi:MAG: hypothetical protein P4M11_13750 [Candidatus Pacebacteria bacterium]|nr:hypothetical protein [Candidatus Paceibacterota bacterium]
MKAQIGKLKLIADHVLTTNAAVVNITKAFLPGKSEATRIMVNCEDTASYVLDETGKVLSTIFPPPSAKSILTLDYCFATNRVYLLLANGSICVYQIDHETALIENIYNVSQIKAWIGFYNKK